MTDCLNCLISAVKNAEKTETYDIFSDIELWPRLILPSTFNQTSLYISRTKAPTNTSFITLIQDDLHSQKKHLDQSKPTRKEIRMRSVPEKWLQPTFNLGFWYGATVMLIIVLTINLIIH